MTSHFLGYLALVIQLVCQGATSVNISGREERVIPAGSNFLLSCHGNESISWTHPNTGDAKFTQSLEKNEDGEYTALLTVESADYLATGYYTCIGRDESARVYVYISDEDHLLAVDPSNVFILGHQYQNVTVPCKPTSPDVNITLMHSDEPVKKGRYDPRVGYTLTNITLLDSVYLTCIGVKDGKENKEDFALIINPHSETAPKPEIIDETIQHVVVGQDVILQCVVDAHLTLSFSMYWEFPEGANLTGRYNIEGPIKEHEDGETASWSFFLNLSGVKKSDEGEYKCRIVDHSRNVNSDTKFLRIFSRDDSFVNVTAHSRVIEVDSTLYEDATWVLTVNAHPNVEVDWYGPNGLELIHSDRFVMMRKGTQIILVIKDVTLADAGNYTFVAWNARSEESVTLELIVLSKPVILIDSSEYYQIGVPANITCFADAYPLPTLSWRYRNCTFKRETHCTGWETLTNSLTTVVEDSRIVSVVEWDMRQPGELSCSAVNAKGNASEIAAVRVTDVPEAFVVGRTPSGVVVEGDDVTLWCGIAFYNSDSYPEWYYETDVDVEPIRIIGNRIAEEARNYSYWSMVHLTNVSDSNSGNYTCRTRTHYSAFSTNFTNPITIEVLRMQPPEINETNLPNSELTLASWQPITWKCVATGVPAPTVIWYKDEDILRIQDEFSFYEILDNNQTLTIKSLTMEEEGKYTCRVTNKGGQVEAFVKLRLKENHRTNTTLIIMVVVVAVLFVIAVFSLIYALWKRAKERAELKLAGLDKFKQGMPKSINQDLTLDQQTESLPYNQKWEFPSSKLKLGKQLGSGAFGVVLKAEAYGIVDEGEWTTVAVKMAKRDAGPAYIKALVSELKILAHLGKHLNVVNLLGACTKNYMKRELLVILEFCKYGNAHNYLLNCRKFIDQIDPTTDEIDPKRLSPFESYNRIRMNYATLTFPRSLDSDANSALTSLNTEMTCLSSDRSAGEPGLNSNNNPLWCPNLQGDYKRYDLDELSTSALVCWSFQVARGMEYLASRRVLHGDLAARNVLIAENNIVKICDFGFAKDIYNHPEYKKTGAGPEPVKWMALESVIKRIFTTESDVWSFGIVLWEFFSLGRTPYPGFENYESILNKLEGGYRMEKPQYANQALYDIMLECWDEQPCRRPSFTELVMKLGKLMEQNVREHYVELNEPFKKQTIPKEEDYLSMMRPPTYEPSSPHYVNEPFSNRLQNQNSDGYLPMRSSWAPVTPKGSNPEDSIEMKPMLSDKGASAGKAQKEADKYPTSPQQKENNYNDDYLIPRKVPANSDCVFNPSYIMSGTAPTSKNSNSHYGKINRS